jgi:hypothetical protein
VRATLYITRGRPVEVEPLLRESVAIEQAADQDLSQIARARNQLGRCLDSLGRRAEAESCSPGPASSSKLRATRRTTELFRTSDAGHLPRDGPALIFRCMLKRPSPHVP